MHFPLKFCAVVSNPVVMVTTDQTQGRKEVTVFMKHLFESHTQATSDEYLVGATYYMRCLSMAKSLDSYSTHRFQSIGYSNTLLKVYSRRKINRLNTEEKL